MQPTTPKEGQHRERPLQKSMFLPEFQPQPILHPRPQPLENIHYNPLKRSSMPVLEGMHQSNLSPSYHAHNISYTQPQYPPNISVPIQFSEMRAQSQHQLLMPNYPNSKSISNIPRNDATSDSEVRGFSKFEKTLGFQAKSMQPESAEWQQLVGAVVEQVKEKHLPALLKGLKKELSDDIGNLRAEIVGLKTQLKAQLERQQLFNNDIKSQTGNIINFNTNNINNINKGKKEETDYKQLEKDFFLLQRKYNQIEVKLSENLTSLYNEFEKITQRLDKDAKSKMVDYAGFKVSAVKSSLSPVMLEYRESFYIKRGEVGKRSGEEEIVIGTCCYYLDRNGYLLDSESKYLTDQRGHQIRLDDKHLKLLQQYKLLHR